MKINCDMDDRKREIQKQITPEVLQYSGPVAVLGYLQPGVGCLQRPGGWELVRVRSNFSVSVSADSTRL